MTALADAIRSVVDAQALTPDQAQAAMADILAGRANDAQIAAFAVAMRMKGETSQELAAFVRVMRQFATTVHHGLSAVVLDTCGTGGDGLSTFNISTGASIIAAAGGVVVAKHGGRAVSSQAGSADVLEALGIKISTTSEMAARSLQTLGLAFLFAPDFHGAMRYARPARQSLGMRTFFNLVGPLSNPAGATHQVVGVYDAKTVALVAEVLCELDVQRAWVVHGHGGMDELSLSGPTLVAEVSQGSIKQFRVSPQDAGLSEAGISAIRGGDAAANGAIINSVFQGDKGPQRDILLMNAGACFVVAGLASDLREGVHLAARMIDSGQAMALLERWRQFS